MRRIEIALTVCKFVQVGLLLLMIALPFVGSFVSRNFYEYGWLYYFYIIPLFVFISILKSKLIDTKKKLEDE